MQTPETVDRFAVRPSPRSPAEIMRTFETVDRFAFRQPTWNPTDEDADENARLMDRRTAETYVAPESDVATPNFSASASEMTGTSLTLRATRRPKFGGQLTPAVIARFIAEQEFEGVVLYSQPDKFIARLHDLTAPFNAPEECEFDLDEVSPDDHKLIVPGALFSWTIGLQEKNNRQRIRVSEIRFRRTFLWKPEKIQSSIAWAESVIADFSDDLPRVTDGGARGDANRLACTAGGT